MFDLDFDFDMDSLLEVEDTSNSDIWFHRIGGIDLYINYDHNKNGLALILTYDEIQKAIADGYEIKGCDSVDSLFDEDSEETLTKLVDNGISLDNTNLEINKKILSTYGNFFDEGLYTIYDELDRTAVHCNEKKLERLFKSSNFGWNNIRGKVNVGIELIIPPACFSDEDPKQLYEVAPPKEIGSEYYGVCKAEKVVPKEYIKRIVYKVGDTVLSIANPNFNKDYSPVEDDNINLYDGTINRKVNKN